MSSDMVVNFKMDGKNWETMQPVRAIAIGLMELDNLIERASLTLEGKKRINQDHRRSQLLATNYRIGSFEADLVLYVASTLSAANATEIMDLVKNGFKVLKFFITSVSKKEIPHINNIGDQNTVISGSGNICNISNNVFNFIINSEKEFQQFGALFKNEGVTTTTIKSDDMEGEVDIDVYFGSSLAQKKIYEKIRRTYSKVDNEKLLKYTAIHEPEVISFKEQLDVKGNIIQFNKINGNGIVSIPLGTILTEGEYEFEIKDYSMKNSLITAMMEREVNLIVQGIYKRGNKIPDKLVITTIS